VAEGKKTANMTPKMVAANTILDGILTLCASRD
jgi:hypothetical protein